MKEKLANSFTPVPWRLEKRVLPQHTDHAGVMWHGAYVGWLEEARVEALATAGLEYAVMADLGMEMPVVSLQLRYRRALRHGDCVTLESRCLPPSGVRWSWRCSLLLQHQVMAEAEVDLVLLQHGRVLRKVPPSVAEAMQALQCGPRNDASVQ